MNFLALVKQQWGKAGCVHCSKPAQKMCACQTSLYCSVSCQAQDWSNHALICGKGDKREGEEQEDKRALKKRELPAMEKKYPKEVLDLLVPFMEGKDLVNFSEATQAGMVAFRNHVAKKHLFKLEAIPERVLLELSPWVARIETTFSDTSNAILRRWPAKHLIQELRIPYLSNLSSLAWIYNDLGIAEFNNLKKLVLPPFSINEEFIQALPTSIETLKLALELELPLFDFTHLTHLSNLRVKFLGNTRKIKVSIARPLEKLRTELGIVQFTTFYPIRYIIIDRVPEDCGYSLDGCKKLRIYDQIGYETLKDRLAKSNVEQLFLNETIRTNVFPPRLKHLSMSLCMNIECRLSSDVTHLSMANCYGRINIPSQLEQIDFFSNDDLTLYDVPPTLDRCTYFNMDMNDSISVAINQMVRALRPSIVKTMVIRQHARQDEMILIENLSAFTALEELVLCFPGVLLNGGDWTPPISLHTLRLEEIKVENTSIQRIPMLIESIHIELPDEKKTLAEFVKQPVLGTEKPFPNMETRGIDYQVASMSAVLPNLKHFYLSLEDTQYFNGKWMDESWIRDVMDSSSSSYNSDDDNDE